MQSANAVLSTLCEVGYTVEFSAFWRSEDGMVGVRCNFCIAAGNTNIHTSTAEEGVVGVACDHLVRNHRDLLVLPEEVVSVPISLLDSALCSVNPHLQGDWCLPQTQGAAYDAAVAKEEAMDSFYEEFHRLKGKHGEDMPTGMVLGTRIGTQRIGNWAPSEVTAAHPVCCTSEVIYSLFYTGVLSRRGSTWRTSPW